MRRIVITLMSFSLVAAYSAFAQDDTQVSTDDQAGVSSLDQGQSSGITSSDESSMNQSQAGTAADQSSVPAVVEQPGVTDNTAISTAEAPAPEKKRMLVDEKIGLKPQFGDFNFRDAGGARSNRAIYGATLDFNMAEPFNRGMGTTYNSLFLGPSLGFFYSHIGGVGGNFFGDNGTSSAVVNSNAGANLLLLPANAKLGWTVGNLRLSAHGGGNVLYRSAANAVLAGKNTPDTSNSKWGILPNAGADLEYGFAGGAAVIIRPDWTFGGSNNLFTGTVGLTIPLA